MTERTPRRGRRRSRWLLAVVVAAAPILVAAPAAQASCRLTDLQCVVNDVVPPATGPVGNALPDPGGVVGDTVHKAKDAVDDLTGTVGDTVDEAKDAVDDTVGQVLNPGGSNPGTGDGGGDEGSDPGSPGTPTPGIRHPRPDALRPPRAGRHRHGSSSITVPTASRVPSTNEGRPASGQRTAVAVRGGLAERLGRAAAAAAKGIGFPLGLAMIVAGFLLVQHRIDEKDPKLVLAPVRPEVVGFE
jgi:hypothetical protein